MSIKTPNDARADLVTAEADLDAAREALDADRRNRRARRVWVAARRRVANAACTVTYLAAAARNTARAAFAAEACLKGGRS